MTTFVEILEGVCGVVIGYALYQVFRIRREVSQINRMIRDVALEMRRARNGERVDRD